MPENNDNNNIDPITDLDAKLDMFLEDENPFDIDPVDPDLIKRDLAQKQENTNNTIQPDTVTTPIIPNEGATTEEKFQQAQVEKELNNMKQGVVPNQTSSSVSAAPVNTDKEVEKKFREKQIDNALEQLKSKMSEKVASPDVTQTSPVETTPKTTDKEIEKKFTDKSINEALETLKAQKTNMPTQQPSQEKKVPEAPPVTEEEIDKSLLNMLKKID